jgi:hypothetical protein
MPRRQRRTKEISASERDKEHKGRTIPASPWGKDLCGRIQLRIKLVVHKPSALSD